MKSKDVLKLLDVSRPTLSKYVREGKLITTKLDNGFYDYDEESVYKILNKKKKDRKIVIYARVSTKKQKNDLENQKETIQNFMIKKWNQDRQDIFRHCIRDDI